MGLSNGVSHTESLRRAARHTYLLSGIFGLGLIDGVIEMNRSSSGEMYGLPDLSNIGTGLFISITSSTLAIASLHRANRLICNAENEERSTLELNDQIIEDEIYDIGRYDDNPDDEY